MYVFFEGLLVKRKCKLPNAHFQFRTDSLLLKTFLYLYILICFKKKNKIKMKIKNEHENKNKKQNRNNE